MSDAIYTLDAEVRTELGKGASRRLRHANKVPAILYGEQKDPISLTLEHKEVIRAQENEGFYSHILTLNIDGSAVECILKDMQRHPYKPKVMHLDFQRIDASHKLQTLVPIHFINEEKANAVKNQGGTVAHQMNEIEVSCLPAHLPEFIEVDVENVELGQTLHISDLTLPKGVESVELAKGDDHNHAVLTINAPKGSSEEATEEAAE
ncbi:50S ribosomal protein L25/general stress protein Ctc [Flocculibacter collagenilyticus]|uniref:50S ribosomal protein L25/general stress protein Ctc n=1 Tax=Flocculibacter collagenilyticus TaxID=2744479 RepID=UPI0018F2BAA3|nr:50S ribosomal protein L25/general stress protein Ctc [Flocculibacter collagenilyticus]